MKPLLSALLIVLSFAAYGQDYYSKDSSKAYAKIEESETTSRFYLGMGMGINNDAGLVGVTTKIRVYRTFLVNAAAGLGSWGTKLTLGAKYEMKYTRCWGFGVSYSRCSGFSDYINSFETTTNPSAEVTMDLLPASTLNLTATYNLYFKRNKLFYLESGYGIPLNVKPYRIKDGSILTPASESLMNFLQPGGIIIGFGFMFGF